MQVLKINIPIHQTINLVNIKEHHGRLQVAASLTRKLCTVSNRQEMNITELHLRHKASCCNAET